MRPYILAESHWDTLRNNTFELAILPWGATEAHNYHLPYATDIIESESLAAESARLAWENGANLIVLPTVPFGVNTGQKDIYLDININPSTQFAILSDIINVLNYQKIYKLLIFNGHGGNDFKPLIRELGNKYPNMFICICNWYQVLDKSKYFDNPGDHADEMETSLVLYLRPDLVLPIDKWGEGREKKNRVKSFSEGWVWAERKWSQVTKDTGIGNPKMGNAEKGKKYFNDTALKISRLISDLCSADIEDMYE